ncbi:MAG: DUF1684 domain-containing protein [Bacteroidales bacterium]|nr:DUF1684 domain-containing protein [Bacteroidales bacterium]
MKKTNFYLLIFIGLFLGACTSQETKEYIAKIQNQRDEKNTEYADSTKSPLNPAHLAEFTGLDYFAIDPKFRITAKLELTPDELPYELTTSTDRRPIYRKYGILHFKINGKPFELSILQNMKFVDDSVYGNLLFIAFQDLTSSKESYGGGRYIDIEIPETETVIVDFNDAYNPYCAYHDRWSCVIPPPENFLEVEIRAGEKKFHLADH